MIRVGAFERAGNLSCAMVAGEKVSFLTLQDGHSSFIPRTVSVFPSPISSQSNPPFGSTSELSRSRYAGQLNVMS